MSLVVVNVVGLTGGMDHAVCFFCGWHSVGFLADHPQHADLPKWAKMHEASCPSRNYLEREA